MESLDELKDELKSVQKYLNDYYWVTDVRNYIKLMKTHIEKNS